MKIATEDIIKGINHALYFKIHICEYMHVLVHFCRGTDTYIFADVKLICIMYVQSKGLNTDIKFCNMYVDNINMIRSLNC